MDEPITQTKSITNKKVIIGIIIVAALIASCCFLFFYNSLSDTEKLAVDAVKELASRLDDPRSLYVYNIKSLPSSKGIQSIELYDDFLEKFKTSEIEYDAEMCILIEFSATNVENKTKRRVAQVCGEQVIMGDWTYEEYCKEYSIPLSGYSGDNPLDSMVNDMTNEATLSVYRMLMEKDNTTVRENWLSDDATELNSDKIVEAYNKQKQ